MPFARIAESRGGVRLRVEIDDERPLAGLGQAGGEIDGGRGLADPALLVRDCVDPSGHPNILSSPADGPAPTSGERPLARDARRGAGSPAASARPFGRRPAPGCSSGAPPPSCAATRATAAASAVGPTSRIAAPPGATSGRHHSSSDRRRRERLRDRHPELVDLLLLRAAADDSDVGEVGGDRLEEHALPPARLEQDHLPIRKRGRERDARRTAARADVHDRRPGSARRAARQPGSRVEVHAAGLRRVRGSRSGPESGAAARASARAVDQSGSTTT